MIAEADSPLPFVDDLVRCADCFHFELVPPSPTIAWQRRHIGLADPDAPRLGCRVSGLSLTAEQWRRCPDYVVMP